MLTFKAAKGNFFDRKVVLNAMSKTEKKEFSKQGAIVRTRARQSMRKRKKPSLPGQPPRVVKGQIKKFLFFSWDNTTRTVVVGPTLLPKGTGAPSTLEYGGTSKGGRNPRRRLRKIGSGGEIRVEGKRVTYARIRTEAQAARANKLNEQLYGPLKFGPARIAKRPFMHPALTERVPKLAPALKDKLRK